MQTKTIFVFFIGLCAVLGNFLPVYAGDSPFRAPLYNVSEFKQDGRYWIRLRKNMALINDREVEAMQFQSCFSPYVKLLPERPLMEKTIVTENETFFLHFKYLHTHIRGDQRGRQDLSCWMTDENFNPYGSIVATVFDSALNLNFFLDPTLEKNLFAEALDSFLKICEKWRGEFKKISICFPSAYGVICDSKAQSVNRQSSFLEAYEEFSKGEQLISKEPSSLDKKRTLVLEF